MFGTMGISVGMVDKLVVGSGMPHRPRLAPSCADVGAKAKLIKLQNTQMTGSLTQPYQLK